MAGKFRVLPSNCLAKVCQRRGDTEVEEKSNIPPYPPCKFRGQEIEMFEILIVIATAALSGFALGKAVAAHNRDDRRGPGT